MRVCKCTIVVCMYVLKAMCLQVKCMTNIQLFSIKAGIIDINAILACVIKLHLIISGPVQNDFH